VVFNGRLDNIPQRHGILYNLCSLILQKNVLFKYLLQIPKNVAEKVSSFVKEGFVNTRSLFSFSSNAKLFIWAKIDDKI
jgi:hypothetical protein